MSKIVIKLTKTDIFDLIDMCYEDENSFLDCMETIAKIILRAVRRAKEGR